MDMDMNGCLSSIFDWERIEKVARREDLCGQILDEFQVSFLKLLILYNTWCRGFENCV